MHGRRVTPSNALVDASEGISRPSLAGFVLLGDEQILGSRTADSYWDGN